MSRGRDVIEVGPNRTDDDFIEWTVLMTEGQTVESLAIFFETEPAWPAVLSALTDHLPERVHARAEAAATAELERTRQDLKQRLRRS